MLRGSCGQPARSWISPVGRGLCRGLCWGGWGSVLLMDGLERDGAYPLTGVLSDTPLSRASPFVGLVGPGFGDAVHQVDQPVVIDAAVLGQADFTGAAGGDAFAAVLHGVLEGAQ